MRLVRLLIALVALGALFLGGSRTCLLHGSHVMAADACGDHGDEHESDSRCESCGQDLLAGQAALAVPSAPGPVLIGLDSLADLLASRLAAPPNSEVDPPPDPVLVRRAFASLTRSLPVRGPNVQA